MKVVNLIIVTLLFTSFAFASNYYRALENADNFFNNMLRKDYCSLWIMMSSKSRSVIVKDILKAAQKDDDLTVENINVDFENCGELTISYWSSFSSVFDPSIVVNDAAWSIKEYSDNNVDISLMYKTSERPAILHMYFEDGDWKIGLVESFWLRKFF